MSQHIAHVNVVRFKYPIDDQRLKPFFDAVPTVNALAERSPGFVWRLSDPDEDARAPEVFGEPNMAIALSVWSSLDALKTFVYRSVHADYLRQRSDWFLPARGANKALWHIAPGARPTILEAKHRLEWLTLNGPGEFAFGFASAT